MCLNKAFEHFQDAYKNFKEMNHLMGKYMSKFNEIETTITDENNVDNKLESDRNLVKL